MDVKEFVFCDGVVYSQKRKNASYKLSIKDETSNFLKLLSICL